MIASLPSVARNDGVGQVAGCRLQVEGYVGYEGYEGYVGYVGYRFQVFWTYDCFAPFGRSQ
jgi:hypothetical protein